MVGPPSQVPNISDNNYENDRESESDGEDGDLSDYASTLDEDTELWVRNIRAEVEANPSSVDEATVMRYWSDMCVGPVGNQHGDRIEDRTAMSSEALDTKITIEELFLRAIPLQHSSRPFLFFNLSDSLGKRFCYRGFEGTEDLDRAVRLAEEGIALFKASPPVENPEQSVDFTATGLLNLGTLLLARYEHLKAVSDLEAAISHTQEALSLLGDANSHYSTRLTALKNLPRMLVLRCQWTRRRQDFEQAIELSKEGLALAMDVHCQDDQVAIYYWSQSIAFEAKYHQTGDIEALSSAIDLARTAEAKMVNIPGKHASYLHYLGVLLDLRYAATSKQEDVEEAIQHAENGLRIGSLSGSSNHFYELLAGLHEIKYHAVGDLHDLNMSLTFRKQAFETAGQEDAMGLIALPGLVTSLRSQYGGIGTLVDLGESLLLLEKSLEDEVDRRERGKLLSALGSMYEARYHLTASVPDLDRAISFFEEALSISPPASPDIARLHGELSFQLQLRYRALNRREDLETAIAWAAQALSETPVISSHRPSILHYLSQSCSLLYLESEDPTDLEFALTIGFEATEEFPEHHPEFASVMINLGELLTRAEPHDPEWLYWALQYFMQAFQCPSASPLSRLNAAEQAANVHITLAMLSYSQVDEEDPLLSIQNHWHNAYELFAEAVGMLPLLSRLPLTLDAQQVRVSQHLSLASNAASMAIRSGKTAFEAARLLETGRGIILDNLVEDIRGLSDLRRAHPELAREFDELRQKVEGLNGSTDTRGVNLNGDVRAGLLMLNQYQQRICDVKSLEGKLRKIREMPGFENFLSLSEAELKLAAKDGPIVAINVTEASSDAILIQTSGIDCLHLPQLRSAWVKTQLGGIDRNILNSRELPPDKNRRMRTLLEVLWDAVVKPVLQALGFYTHEKISVLPHVWWMGVGIMARAPFHAAGCYPKSPNSKTADYASKYCISSYTPAVRSLLHSRARERRFLSSSEPPNPADKILFITSPHTPGGEVLPQAREAVDSILASLPSAPTKTHLIGPSSTLALERICEHNVVHFTCRGITDSANPSKSRIFLLNSPDSESLTIEQISAALTLQPVYPTSIHYLAFLAECICTEFTGADLAEEVLHIGSGFQLAGFSHVVGTLWSGDHTVGKKISEEFFKNLFNSEGSASGSTGGDGAELDDGDRAAADFQSNSVDGLRFPISGMTCAEALHRAVEKVKIGEGYWWNLLDWAQFCHWGI